MESFLKLVAADLYKHTEGNLAHTAVVFPNKRAGLFFNEYLAQESESPIWSPAYVSISELFRSLSPWEVGDPVKLVCELYKIFRRETQSTETLDDFYFWGEMLISDFDDADKNKVDTDKLFSNLQDLRNIMDDYTFIDDEQEEAIRQFFQNFSIERRTALKERFISLWDVLGNIYKGFRESLASQNIAYEGMMYRHVIEHPAHHQRQDHGPAGAGVCRVAQKRRVHGAHRPARHGLHLLSHRGRHPLLQGGADGAVQRVPPVRPAPVHRRRPAGLRRHGRRR